MRFCELGLVSMIGSSIFCDCTISSISSLSFKFLSVASMTVLSFTLSSLNISFLSFVLLLLLSLSMLTFCFSALFCFRSFLCLIVKSFTMMHLLSPSVDGKCLIFDVLSMISFLCFFQWPWFCSGFDVFPVLNSNGFAEFFESRFIVIFSDIT